MRVYVRVGGEEEREGKMNETLALFTFLCRSTCPQNTKQRQQIFPISTVHDMQGVLISQTHKHTFFSMHVGKAYLRITPLGCCGGLHMILIELDESALPIGGSIPMGGASAVR